MSPTSTGETVHKKTPEMKNSDNKKGLEICQHIVKSTSLPGLRKALKGDIRAVCCFKPLCENAVDSDFVPWMCLQCGSIGCGKDNAQGGHAEGHSKTPRSDSHHIAVLFQRDLEKAWCFACNFELETNSSPFFKDSITFLRRNMKIKTALSLNSPNAAASGPPIVLGAPPPPPAPKIEPPKQLPFKKQNKVSPSSSSRWDSNDWPLGLDNLGNTCFMNSVLQCLSRTRSLMNKLDLYGAGNTIEILVTSEEPCVQIVNSDACEEAFKSNFVSEECDSLEVKRFDVAAYYNGESSGVETEDSSPSSTDIDSLLGAANGPSTSKTQEISDSIEREKWIKELDQELKQPLRLRLCISKDSMAAKLRHCFKAITRTPDAIPDGDSYDRSEFYCRSSNYPTVFSPRAVHFALNRNFRPGQQHDSHELLRTVVDMMKKDQIKAFRLAIMDRYGVKKSEGKNCDPKVAELLKMWDRKLYHKTFVDEIFGGELVTTQKCLQCNSVRRSHEEFLDLSLPIRVFRTNPNPSKKAYSLFEDDHDYVINRSVEDCLRAYTEPEFLTGSNVVECENCHRSNLARLEAGAVFEEVFPDFKAKVQSPNKSGDRNSTDNSKFHPKKQNKKRQSRQAKIKAKLDQSNIVQENSDMDTGSSLPIVEDHFKRDQMKLDVKSTSINGEEDGKSSKSGSLDDYVFIQSTPMVKELENKIMHAEMDVDVDLLDVDACPAHITGDNTHEAIDMRVQQGTQSNLSEGLSSSLKNLSFIENDMDYDDIGRLEEEMMNQSANETEDMDDLDEPAVDGVGNASDIEDEEGNGLVPLDLEFVEDQSIVPSEYLTIPVVPGTSSSTVADEGFSEGENSSEEKQSQSLSASSSRNSISEGDNSSNPSENASRKIPVTKCPCSRQQLISRPPDCLTLHLKRFQHTGRGSSKLSDRVTFPYILNLTEFCSEVGEDSATGKSIFDEDGQVMYSLYGLVEHSGSLHFGHYVAYVKVSDKDKEVGAGDRASDKWFYISDSHVSSSSLKSVLSQDAYLLFYERITGDVKRERLSGFGNTVDVGNSAQNGFDDTTSEWNTSTYNYDKPATATVASDDQRLSDPAWDENWADSNTQQVSSSNDNDTGIDFASDTVSSSSLYPITTLHTLDDVSSTTDAMDYIEPVPDSVPVQSLSHPIWDDDEVRIGIRTIYEDSTDPLLDNSAPSPVTTYEAVSSSSDIQLVSKLDQVD